MARICPFTACGATIPDHRFACPPHWFEALNNEQRERIGDSYHSYLRGRLTVEELRIVQQSVLDETELGGDARLGDRDCPLAVPRPQEAKCKSCGARILWVRTYATDSLIPLDAEPCADGNIYLLDGKAQYLKGELFDMEPREGPLYKTHFATCPSAATHRKSRKGRTE